MKSIVVVGWDKSLNNAGDQILIEATHYLCKKVSDNNIIDMDWENTNRSVIKKVLRTLYYRFISLFSRINWDSNKKSTQLRYSLQKYYFELGVKSYYKNFLKNNNAIAVVVAGGGALKYKTQNHSFYTEILLETAARLGLPVMLNAIGIEGYSSEDIRCRKLIETLNSSTVKVVTTRDDIEALRNHFVLDKSIVTAKVGDPALWISNVYGIKKNENSNLIGINLVRGHIFLDYDEYPISFEETINLYCDIIKQLEKEGFSWELFTNGMTSDCQFGEIILEKIHRNDKEILIASNTADYVKMVSQFKGVIGGRMHALITSYSLDIPIAGFVWSEKIKYFGETTKIDSSLLEKEKISGENLVLCLKHSLITNYDIKTREILKQNTFDYINSFISSL